MELLFVMQAGEKISQGPKKTRVQTELRVVLHFSESEWRKIWRAAAAALRCSPTPSDRPTTTFPSYPYQHHQFDSASSKGHLRSQIFSLFTVTPSHLSFILVSGPSRERFSAFLSFVPAARLDSALNCYLHLQSRLVASLRQHHHRQPISAPPKHFVLDST